MMVTTVSPATEPALAPALLDVAQVAELLSCSTRHVYRLCDRGRMPAPRKLGALCRWSRGEIMAWIEGGCLSVRHIAAKGGAA